MKIILYIRRDRKHPALATMDCISDEEPCYDTPRILNLGADIKAAIDNIIADCRTNGYISATVPIKTAKEGSAASPPAAPRANLKGAKA